MSFFNEELRIKDHILFDLSECADKFSRLRPSKDHGKQTCSPRLADIGKSPDFRDLIYLCSEHSPSVLRPVLEKALSKCAESERRIESEQQIQKSEALKKRDAEREIGPESHKHARLPQARKSVFRASSKRYRQLYAVTKSHNRSSTDGSRSRLPNNVGGASEPPASDTTSPLPSDITPVAGSKAVEVFQSQEGTVESPCLPDLDQSRISTPQPSQGISQIETAACKVPTVYEMELGLIQGEEEIHKIVMDKCMPLSLSHRANKHFDRKVELQELFETCRKLPLRIVKACLLRELRSRIEVPGTRTQIPLTGNMSNSSDILDALQCIKGTTINAKTHRAYGQIKLFRSVQDDIAKGNVPYASLENGVSAHTVILEEAASRAAGKVSQKERTERKHFFNDEYNAGKKWVDVCEWFSGPGIVLIFVTAGIGISFVPKKWTSFQRDCLQTISIYLPSITGLVKVLGAVALEEYCQNGYLKQENIDAINAYDVYTPANLEADDEYAEDNSEAEADGQR